MLTKAQRTIIKDVCSIQYDSLTRILIQIDLGEDPDGDKYEDVWEMMGFSRKEFDKNLIETIHRFKDIKKNPEKVFDMIEIDTMVFEFILNGFRHKWVNKYPKAYKNLQDKLFISSVSKH